MKVKEGLSTIDVFLKKRYDLIPNLVETVKGYAFSQPARIYAQNDSVLWVSDTHSSKRTLVKMLVHKGEIRE